MHQLETSPEVGTDRHTSGGTWLPRVGVIGATALAACLTAAPAQAIPGDDVVKETGRQATAAVQQALNTVRG
ncbi:hypothetical protein [Streptomyces sp. NPDC017529]|uniref:hypothetical protein n=1 Tax=Streptomyces sp. NPDC017529 TaxID=3365000 RepID=UPI0037BC6908